MNILQSLNFHVVEQNIEKMRLHCNESQVYMLSLIINLSRYNTSMKLWALIPAVLYKQGKF